MLALECLIYAIGIPEDERSTVFDTVHDLRRITDNFMNLTLANEMRFEETTLIGILRRALKPLTRPDARITVNGFSLETYPEKKDQYELVADKAKLADVFFELGTNSLKWARKSPHEIKISVDQVTNGSAADRPKRDASRRFRIVFEDSGRGVTASIKPKLFQPFVSGAQGGTGLGLAIVNEIIRSHHGAIKETGAPDQGARFEIILPIDPRKPSM